MKLNKRRAPLKDKINEWLHITLKKNVRQTSRNVFLERLVLFVLLNYLHR